MNTAPESYRNAAWKSFGSNVVEIGEHNVPALIQRAWEARVRVEDVGCWSLATVRAERAAAAAPPLSFELDCVRTLSSSDEEELGGTQALAAIVERAHAAGVTVEGFRAWALGEAREERAARLASRRVDDDAAIVALVERLHEEADRLARLGATIEPYSVARCIALDAAAVFAATRRPVRPITAETYSAPLSNVARVMCKNTLRGAR